MKEEIDISKIKIDKEELTKQNNENIKKSGTYIEVHLCIGLNNEPILPIVNVHKVTATEIAKMITGLNNIIEYLEEQSPEAKLIKNFMSSNMEAL